MTITKIFNRMMKTSFIAILIVVCLATTVDMAPVKTNLAVEERAFASTTVSTSTSSPEPPAPAMF